MAGGGYAPRRIHGNQSKKYSIQRDGKEHVPCLGRRRVHR